MIYLRETYFFNVKDSILVQKKILYNKILPHKKHIITNSGFLFKSFPNLIVWHWNKEDAIIMKVKIHMNKLITSLKFHFDF